MGGFLGYFLGDKRKTRSLKRNFLGSLCRNISCSGSRDRDGKRIMTPVNKKLNLNLNNLSCNKNSAIPKRTGYIDISKSINKAAERRQITLYSKERKHLGKASDKIVTTATRSRRKHQKPTSNRLEINLGRQNPINSEKDTYSVGLSTQNQRILFRTLDNL